MFVIGRRPVVTRRCQMSVHTHVTVVVVVVFEVIVDDIHNTNGVLCYVIHLPTRNPAAWSLNSQLAVHHTCQLAVAGYTARRTSALIHSQQLIETTTTTLNQFAYSLTDMYHLFERLNFQWNL